MYQVSRFKFSIKLIVFEYVAAKDWKTEIFKKFHLW